MQKTDIPNKFLVAWAQGDSSRVEVPVTTSDATRASQTLGFPPLTMQPPEAGGKPPNGEDFNGGLNQIARVARWMMAGSDFPYDNAFATASQIGGYASGAVIPRADGTGYWVSIADNNTTNPDATDGTAANWLPAWVSGSASVSVSSTDVTVYPVTAAKQILLISGTLTANRNIILPAWTYNWQIIDNTVRAGFTLTAKTASGAGVLLQTGQQCVRGDGTNIVQTPQSIAAATIGTQAAQLAQVVGLAGQVRRLAMSLTAASATATFTADEVLVETAVGGTVYRITNLNQALNLAATGINGMDTGTAPVSGYVAVYAGVNPTTGAKGVWAQAVSGQPTSTYTGANAPSGYTASGLIAIVPTNPSGQFVPCFINDRKLSRLPVGVLFSSPTSQGSFTSLSIANAVPPGAKRIYGYTEYTGSIAANISMYVAADSTGLGQLRTAGVITNNGQPLDFPFVLDLLTSQTLYYTATTSGGSPTYSIVLSAYEI